MEDNLEMADFRDYSWREAIRYLKSSLHRHYQQHAEQKVKVPDSYSRDISPIKKVYQPNVGMPPPPDSKF